jgi:hypothetical protein
MITDLQVAGNLQSYQMSGDDDVQTTLINAGIGAAKTVLDSLVARYISPDTSSSDKAAIAVQIKAGQDAINQKLIMYGAGVLLAGVVLYVILKKKR